MAALTERRPKMIEQWHRTSRFLTGPPSILAEAGTIATSCVFCIAGPVRGPGQSAHYV